MWNKSQDFTILFNWKKFLFGTYILFYFFYKTTINYIFERDILMILFYIFLPIFYKQKYKDKLFEKNFTSRLHAYNYLNTKSKL